MLRIVSAPETIQFLIAKYHVVVRDPRVNMKTARNGVTKELKREIRRRALIELTKKHGFNREQASFIIGLCEIHHKTPLGLGGTNDICNFAYVEKHLHAAIHRYIEAQLHCDGPIIIPESPNGETVWICGHFSGMPIKFNDCRL